MFVMVLFTKNTSHNNTINENTDSTDNILNTDTIRHS